MVGGHGPWRQWILQLDVSGAEEWKAPRLFKSYNVLNVLFFKSCLGKEKQTESIN